MGLKMLFRSMILFLTSLPFSKQVHFIGRRPLPKPPLSRAGSVSVSANGTDYLRALPFQVCKMTERTFLPFLEELDSLPGFV
jgi:hypothetical protein